jgi:hypothetical protein
MIQRILLKALPVLAVVALLCLAVDSAYADDPPQGEKAKKAKKGTQRVVEAAPDADADAADEGGGLQAAKFLPLGKPNLKVKIPQFKDGELECVMRAEEMTRIGDDDIDIKTMNIEFVEDGEPSMTIKLLEANYNLTDRLLSTDKRAVVQRADFTLVGDSLDFDTVKRHGRMMGKVRMVIHDSSGFVKEKEQDEAAILVADAGVAGVISGPWVGKLALELSVSIREKAKIAAGNETGTETPNEKLNETANP